MPISEKLNLAEKLNVVASGLVILGAGFIIYDLFKGPVPFDWGTRGTGGKQSPIRIIGGSISPLAKGGWSECGKDGSGNVNCLVSTATVDTTVVSTDADLPDPLNSSEEPTAWLLGKTSQKWTISVYSWRDTYGIRICPSDKNGSCGQSGPKTYVSATIIVSGPYFVRDSPHTKDYTYYRYYDPNTTADNDQTNAKNYYEHIKNLQIANIDADSVSSGNPYTYKCTNGRCTINIGQ